MVLNLMDFYKYVPVQFEFLIQSSREEATYMVKSKNTMPKKINQNLVFVELDSLLLSVLFFLVKKMLEIARAMPPIGHSAARMYPYFPVNTIDWKNQFKK